MCGIAGYYGRTHKTENILNATLDSMIHRGPNNKGKYENVTNEINTYLLHTRLSIIDLDKRSNQPFRIGNNILILNGEIYNYIELRKELEDLGHKFITSGDTEVLAKVLMNWGLEGVKRLEGMWAFCWFRETDQTLTLCRDRFGEKPLYYFEENGELYFASEPKSIFALFGKTLRINEEQLSRYLVNGYKSLYKKNETFFKGLREIKPGEYKVYNKSSSKNFCYWKKNFNTQNNNISYEEAVEISRDALEKSINLRLRSDVPVAFFLSGGVDSNALISLASQKYGYDVHGFTIMNTDERYEERDLINASVKKYGIKHTAVNITSENFLEKLRTLIKAHNSPVYTINYFAQWELMKKIQSLGYKVTISGIGADEIFSGYYDHHLAYLFEMYKRNKKRYSKALYEWRENIFPIVRNPFLQDPEYFIKNPALREHIFLNSELFNSFLKNNFKEEFSEETYSKDLLRNRMANELFHESIPVLLHEDDLNSMFYSIENRSPFLDSNLFEICQSIPTEHLIKNGMAKSILRDIVKDLAPQEVIYSKRKVGFNIPINNYIDLNNKDVVDQILSPCKIFDIVDKSKIQEILKPGNMSNSLSKFIFNFINAKIFCEEFS